MSLPSTFSQPYRPLATISEDSRQTLDAINRGLTEFGPGRYTISRSVALSDDQRRWIEGRRAEVRAAMAFTDRQMIEDRIHGFAFGFSQLRSLDAKTLQGVLFNFVEAVDHLPFEAVSRACTAWNKNKFRWAKPAFPPQAPELARASEEMLAALKCEEHKLRIILGAEVEPEPAPKLTAAQMNEMQGKWANVLAGIVGRSEVEMLAVRRVSPERAAVLKELGERRARRERNEDAEPEADPNTEASTEGQDA